jgi:uncharacterized membrane protein HdeD (DUF308 family)
MRDRASTKAHNASVQADRWRQVPGDPVTRRQEAFMATVPPPTSDAGQPVHHRGWCIFWGALLIVLGVLALLMPEVAALATALTLAWLLIFAGGVEIVHAIQTRYRNGFGWKLASGIVTLLLGVSILIFPVAGIATLALWIGAFVFVGGLVRLILALRLKPERGWGWVLVDGLLSIAVGGLIAWGWPASSIPFIGLLAGFWLIFAGIWRVMLDGRAARPGSGRLSPGV